MSNIEVKLDTESATPVPVAVAPVAPAPVAPIDQSSGGGGAGEAIEAPKPIVPESDEPLPPRVEPIQPSGTYTVNL